MAYHSSNMNNHSRKRPLEISKCMARYSHSVGLSFYRRLLSFSYIVFLHY